MESALILFYIGSHPDHRGRLLAEILAQDDLWFEVTHDYVQWLFPTCEWSRVNAHAPAVCDKDIATFRGDDLLQNHLRASFRRMLAFFGLTGTSGRIDKAPHWPERKTNWFTEDTHNNLRITRIIKSLRCLGLAAEANAFHATITRLRDSEPDCGIGEEAFRYWSQATEATL